MKTQLSWFMVITLLAITFAACDKLETPQQTSNGSGYESQETTGIDGYRVSISQDGEKEIYCTEDRKLVLVFDDQEKVIYEDYRIITNNPYSIWDFDQYKIQWSGDSNYVYIIDSIYDFKNDSLIPIDDCVVFSWVGNKGAYLADGTYYEISYDGGLQNEMAVGKKIKIIENGVVQEVAEQTGDRYFVFDEYINVSMKEAFGTIGDGYISINTASLKYSEEQLQEKINEEVHSDDFREFLHKHQGYDSEIQEKATEVINKIKELKEFQDLQEEMNNLEKSYPIEFEGGIKELIAIVNDNTYCGYNVSGRYFLKDIRQETVDLR